MTTPKFSIVMIAKNEAKTLRKCMTSLQEFRDRGGEIILVDTGSTDGTADIAREYGCKVEEVGEKFIQVIDQELADKINEHFLVEGEPKILNAGNRLFNFAAARNYATSLASNNMVCTLDCDEAYSKLDIDKLNELIDMGYGQFEYQFVFAHDQYGRPAIQFVQSKFFDKTKIQWTGVVHEVLSGDAMRMLLGTDVIYLEHWQIPGGEHRSNYLVGLALDCFENPSKDRQSHYFARELMWTGHPRSALKEFERHITMGGWQAERAQSMIFMGDCYGMIGDGDKQLEWYHKAFALDPNRREALIKLARFYKEKNMPAMTMHYAKMSLDIPWTDYYANDKAMYEQGPHELLYWAYGWLGDIQKARIHLLKCMEYLPGYYIYQRDFPYYFDYPGNNVDGYMSFEELNFLYTTAKRMESVAELGSWKGRSTNALASGCGGTVTAIDTFMGSQDPLDWTMEQAKKEDIYATFLENTKQFSNIVVNKKDGTEASKDYADKSFDMVFIDAEHTYEALVNDIRHWKGKAKILLCGHDYCDAWKNVVRAVDEELGGPDEVHGSIWVKWVRMPKVSVCVPTLGRPEKLHRLLEKIKLNAGYENYEIIVKADEPVPNNIGAPKMLKKCVDESTGELVMFLGNDTVPEPNFMLEAVWEMARRFPDFDGMVGLNDGYWHDGDVATHWLASKKLLPALDGEFFHTGYNHAGCDNELLGRVEKLGKYSWAEKAKLYHDHPVNTGWANADESYRSLYSGEKYAHDLALLKSRGELLGFAVRA
jgi:glycosyltransferase involved in cell wall biosynthesis